MARPRPASGRALRFFGFSEADPWTWIPGHWVRPGVVFITHDNKLFEIIKKAEGGWDCEEQPVRDPAQTQKLVRLTTRLAELDKATAALVDLMAKAEAAPDDKDIREFVRQRSVDRQALADDLIHLCNPDKSQHLDRDTDFDRLLVKFLPVFVGAFAVALAWCVTQLYRIEPEHTTGWILTTVLFFAAWTAICIGIWLMWKYRRRLPLAQITGWVALVALLLLLLAGGLFVISFMGGAQTLIGNRNITTL
jgi:hypothetical protein